LIVVRPTVFDAAIARDDIRRRNQLRTDARLPALDVETELMRLERVDRENRYWNWCQSSPLRERVRGKMLARVRRRIKNPEWVPTGFLSGGGYAFSTAVNRQMARLWRRLRLDSGELRVE
jgi:hypothetical protein